MRASIDVGQNVIPVVAINAAIKLAAGATLPQSILTPPGELVVSPDGPAILSEPAVDQLINRIALHRAIWRAQESESAL